MSVSLSAGVDTVLTEEAQRIGAVPETLSRLRDAAERSAFDTLRRLIGITTDLFQGPVTVKESFDPEFPAERYIVFVVEVQADSPATLKLESEWVRQVSALTPHWDGFRLLIKRKK
jgi:hypothetical protein